MRLKPDGKTLGLISLRSKALQSNDERKRGGGAATP